MEKVEKDVHMDIIDINYVYKEYDIYYISITIKKNIYFYI